MKTALLIGATGAIGTALLHQLLNSKEYIQIHCIVRRPFPFSHDKLITHQIDFEKITQFDLTQSHKDSLCIHVFCCLGTTLKQAGSISAFKKVDKDYVLSCITLAETLCASHFSLISSVGANSASSNYYLQTKGDVETQLIESNIKYIQIFRPSLLYGRSKPSRAAESIASLLLRLIRPLLVGQYKKYRPIHINQVAKAIYMASKQAYPKIKIFESDEIQQF